MTNSLPARKGSTPGSGRSNPPRLDGGGGRQSRPKARRAARDREFLPAALEIIESPPSPVHNALMLAICLLLASALAWASIGTVDIVSVAVGKIQPQGRVKTIQSVATGRVKALDVANGARVTAGQVLFTLDPAETEADESEIEEGVLADRAEAAWRTAAVAAVRDGVAPRPDWPDGLSASVRARETEVLRSEIDSFHANLDNLQAQLAQKTAEGERLAKTVAAQSALVDTLKERVDMRTTLLTSGAGPKAAVLDARENYETQAANLAYQVGQIAENQAALQVARANIAKATTDFIADNETKRAEAERKADDEAQKLRKAEIRRTETVVTAPVGGIVQGSTLTTEGQVVSPGEEVMRIVPDTATLEVEAYLPNKDVGFVTPGQTAVIKIESFPFTRYGTLTGRVVRVATDAIAASDVEQSEAAPARALRETGVAGGQHMQNLVFPVTIALERTAIRVDGADVPLSPGMSVMAEIKTGRRRMIDYLLSPVVEAASTAMRER